MKNFLIFIFLTGIIFSYIPLTANAIDLNSYPLNKTERGLTIPEKIHEISYAGTVLKSNSGYDFNPGFCYSYGITDNLTADIIGLKYRFLDSSYPVELAARIGLGELSFGYGEKSGKHFKISSYNTIEGKQRFSKNFYAKYHLFHEKIIRDTEVPEKWRAGAGLGAYYSFTDSFETGVFAFYDLIDGFKKEQRAERLGLSAIYAYSHTLDIGIRLNTYGFATGMATKENPYNDKIAITLFATGRMVWK